jgi:Spy/CpxP family protein refolding chaperone
MRIRNTTRIGLAAGTLLLALLAVLPAAAQMPPHRDDFMDRVLFPPDVILEHRTQIGLTDDQLAKIKQTLGETHARVVDLQVDMKLAGEDFKTVLLEYPVDEGRALQAAEGLMARELEMKRIHLSLLIRLKNLLTEEQVRQLESLR